ncbi:MAG: two-partner secretion domain-containing protein, partial [Acidiferrobacteraceae bacterium]
MSLRRFVPYLILSTLVFTPVVNAAPLGGQVVAGSGQIAQTGNLTTITQSSPTVALDWQSFNVAPNETVHFIQPSAQSLAVNHILGSNGSVIAGHLDANGQVWLINPNGILFSQTATVNVGGLVASTLNPSGFTGGNTLFQGGSTASILNDGHLTAAPGGYVALLGNQVQNQGTISAPLGAVAMAGGNRVLLQFQNDALLNVAVDGSALHSLAANGGLITTPGGQVQLTAGAANSLLASAVNNTGVIEAQTVADHHGRITLLGGMTAGTVNVAGTLDASAPNGGNGGAITTSAAHVQVANGATVTTAARQGTAGTWVIDPTDYTVAASGGNITGAQLSTNLGSGNITILSSGGTTGTSGNININDPVSWSANTTLTLTAANNINFNVPVTATGATAGLVLNPDTANGADTASGVGVVNFNGASSVTLSGSTPSLSIGGTPYTVINSASALQAIGSTGNYALGSNLNLTGVTFTPLGGSGFAGTFTGLGHTISNLSITSSATDVGLFGITNTGSTISNVGLVGGSVSGSATNADIGALVGSNAGTIARSFATGSVMGTALNASDSIGGLAGFNGGNILRSYATGAVSGGGGCCNSNDGGGLVGGGNGTGFIGASYATGNVSGMNMAGGLVGLETGDVQNSYATGNVSGTTDVGGLIGINAGPVDSSYATGNATGGPYSGGLVGAAYGTYFEDYWDTSSSGTTAGVGTGSSSGITGLSSAQMVTPSSFTG